MACSKSLTNREVESMELGCTRSTPPWIGEVDGRGIIGIPQQNQTRR
jgi:hypothetical protein